MAQASPRLIKSTASPRRLPPLQLERETAALLRPGLDRTLRSQFADQLKATGLSPSRAMITSTIGPLTSEQRENNLQLTPTEIAAQAHASHTAALKLKVLTRQSDIFHVEATAANKAAIAARANKRAQKELEGRQRARDRSMAALDAKFRRGLFQGKVQPGALPWVPPSPRSPRFRD